MRPTTLLVLVGIGLLAATGTALAADNTAPLPDAGVDQTVTVDSTVYLDATASTDPDGEVTAVAWSVETPSGETISPDCAQCRRTEFDADTLGRYTVTLSVTDDDGATRSDTLYVTVTNDTGPSVSLAGPSTTAPDTSATFTATAREDDADLETLTWMINDTVVGRETLDGSSATVSVAHSFDTTGDVPVRAVVYDTLGNRGSTTRTVSVEEPSPPPLRPNGTVPDDPNATVPDDPNVTVTDDPNETGPNVTQTGGDDWVNRDPCEWEDISDGPCRPEADLIVNDTDGRRVEDINGEPGLQVQTENGIRDYGEVEDLSIVERGPDGTYFFTGQGSVQDQLERADSNRYNTTNTDVTENDSSSSAIGDGEQFRQNQSNSYKDNKKKENRHGSDNNSHQNGGSEAATDIVPNVDTEDVSEQSNDDSGDDPKGGAYGIP